MPTYAPIEWDATGERLYENGIDHGVLYVQDSSGAYPKGVAWNGLTSYSESPDGGDVTDLWADNIKYGSLRAAENFKGTIEAYTYPEEFAACDGSATVAAGVYAGQQKRQPFGFCCRTMVASDTSTEGTETYKLHLVYNATVSPSDKTYETINDSPDAITFSWEFDTIPINVTGYKPTACITIDSTKADATNLAALLVKLYGSTTADAYLPLPDEVISTMNATHQ